MAFIFGKKDSNIISDSQPIFYMKTDQEKYDELALYTLQHKDPSFIHQYIVDAYAAQHADENTKLITLTFALVGLYLHIEKNYSGREVQLMHMKMAKVKKEWPKFFFPSEREDITIEDVLKAEPGMKRDEMIKKWSLSVWTAWSENRQKIIELLASFGIINL